MWIHTSRNGKIQLITNKIVSARLNAFLAHNSRNAHFGDFFGQFFGTSPTNLIFRAKIFTPSCAAYLKVPLTKFAISILDRFEISRFEKLPKMAYFWPKKQFFQDLTDEPRSKDLETGLNRFYGQKYV
jgi:hypothetical protein